MTLALSIALLVVLLLLSATYSGSETGIYSVSRVQLDVEGERGRWSARILRRLLRDDAGLLVTLLVGNNLMLELLTHRCDALLAGALPAWAREITIALVLTPFVFLLGELVPKDQFHRRPLRLLALASPLIAVSRVLFFPLVWPIQSFSRLLERRFRIEARALAGALSREELFDVLQASRRAGALAPRAEALARNVLELRETPVAEVMVPWPRVRTLDLGLGEPELRDVVERSDFSRLPVLEPTGDGGAVVTGYAHLLDLVGDEGSLASSLRPLPALGPEEPVDRALAKLRISGQRLALVGTPDAPLGLVTLMDLVEAISRQSRSDA